MNTDPESIFRELIAWLLQDPNSVNPFNETGSHSSSFPSVFASGVATPFLGESTRTDSLNQGAEVEDYDPLDSEGIDLAIADCSELPAFSPHSGSQPLRSGEIFTVQDRYYALLKRRLQTEIQRHPPLFPWESEISDYELDLVDSTVTEQVPSRLWAAQLRNLNIPVPVPEVVLAQLFEQCQSVVQSSMREGAKLVRAVEGLFPNQAHTLNDLAGMMLMSPSRSGSVEATLNPSADTGDEATKLPNSYEQATPEQRMVWSLLAAREILQSLTLTVSASQSAVERQWLTAAGLLTLELRYQPQGEARLRVQGRMPCGGSLTLQGEDAQAIAHRVDAGGLSVELFNIQPHHAYTLKVTFDLPEQEPLTFAVQPVS